MPCRLQRRPAAPLPRQDREGGNVSGAHGTKEGYAEHLATGTRACDACVLAAFPAAPGRDLASAADAELDRSEEHTSELQSPDHLVCRLLLEKKKKINQSHTTS